MYGIFIVDVGLPPMGSTAPPASSEDSATNAGEGSAAAAGMKPDVPPNKPELLPKPTGVLNTHH